MSTYDYVVVGGGSAGCTIATRLIQAGKSVLLLEAGPKDSCPWIHIPAALSFLHAKKMWKYRTAPEEFLGNRSVPLPQGRVLGGGSSVNAMIYIRGQAQDYDGWREAGCSGWGYEDVLPYFRKAEGNERLSGRYHGSDGPLKVSDARHRHPLSVAFVKAAQEAGIPYNDDFNGASQAGVGFYQTTTTPASRRASAAATYLRSVRGNPNLNLITDAHVTGLVLENGAAVGVRVRHDNGQETEQRVREEVILTAGTLSTPKILMLAGIGPARHLAEHGISVLRDHSGVGENFQDHLGVAVYGQTRDPISLLGHEKGLKAVGHMFNYAVLGKGVLTSNVVETGGFVDTSGAGRPDIQFHVIPRLTGNSDRPAPPGHGVSISPCNLRPKSRGHVRLASNDPLQPMQLNARYLSAPEDMATLVRGVKLARKILRSPSLAKLISHEIGPSSEENVPDSLLEDHIRKVSKTVFHPVGTCRMGADDKAVVDTSLRVRGVPRLRVADASIMPNIVSGNTNAPSIMIGERCADILLSKSGVLQ